MHRSVALLAVVLAGCASFIDRNRVPGVSNQTDAGIRLGPPTDRLARPDGGSTWYYSRQPLGRQTWALEFDAGGTLRSIEPILDSTRLAKVVVGKTTGPQLRELLGPPNRIERMPRQRWSSWEYWMVVDAVPAHVWIQLSDDGIVREVVKSEDLSRDPGRWRD